MPFDSPDNESKSSRVQEWVAAVNSSESDLLAQCFHEGNHYNQDHIVQQCNAKEQLKQNGSIFIGCEP